VKGLILQAFISGKINFLGLVQMYNSLISSAKHFAPSACENDVKRTGRVFFLRNLGNKILNIFFFDTEIIGTVYLHSTPESRKKLKQDDPHCHTRR
jgi:hypothetical protein